MQPQGEDEPLDDDKDLRVGDTAPEEVAAVAVSGDMKRGQDAQGVHWVQANHVVQHYQGFLANQGAQGVQLFQRIQVCPLSIRKISLSQDL